MAKVILTEAQPDSSCGIAGFVDVETTGFSPVTDEVVELAICLFEFKRATGQITQIIENYVGLREPKKSIPAAATRVHGLKTADVKGKKLDHGIIESMIHKAEFLVAHNAPFDYGFMSRLFKICQEKPWLCSMRGIGWYQKGYPSMGLQNLLKCHGITPEKAHRAEHDVEAAIKLLSLSPNGKTYFLELLHKLPRR